MSPGLAARLAILTAILSAVGSLAILLIAVLMKPLPEWFAASLALACNAWVNRIAAKRFALEADDRMAPLEGPLRRP